MPAPGVVPELDVVVDRCGQLDPCLPFPAVQELNLHPSPEALHHRVVICRSDGPHRWCEAVLADALAERPRRKLNAALGMDHEPVAVLAALGGHPERVEDQRRCLCRVNGPANDLATERVQDRSAVDLPFTSGVLGDISQPQLIRRLAPEHSPDQVQ